MADHKWKILSKETKFGKDGKKQGVYAHCDDEKVRTFLNPHGKGAKYAAELKYKTRFTNCGDYKVDSNGEPLALTKTGAAWRSGYLQAQKDSAKAYNARQAAGAASKPKGKSNVKKPKNSGHTE